MDERANDLAQDEGDELALEDGAQGPLEAELVLDGAADDVTGLAPAFASEPRPPAASGRERSGAGNASASRSVPGRLPSRLHRWC